jgi:polyisoprenoid-binding protein YceI
MTAVATPTQTSARPTIRKWTIDPVHSTAEFAVRHLMISTIKGRFSDLSGAIKVDEINPSDLSIEVTIPAATVDTRQPDRDAHLRSADFFDVEHHPEITFKARHIEGDLESAFRLVGELTMHGVTREVALDVTAEGQGPNPFGPGERAGYSAKTTLDRREFGLTWNKALETGGVAVGHDISVSIELELVSDQTA